MDKHIPDLRNIGYFEYQELVQRLDSILKIDFEERLAYIEKQMSYISMAFNSINTTFQRRIKIEVEEEALNIIKPLKEVLDVLKAETLGLQKMRKEIQSDTVIGTVKFMSKTLHELTQEVHSIKENGIKKSVHLALTMDGHELTQKKSPARRAQDDWDDKKTNNEDSLRKLLDTLSEPQALVLTHRYGLFGEKIKTLEATGKLLGVTRERIRQMQSKALRTCRTPNRKGLVKDITYLELREDILGVEE